MKKIDIPKIDISIYEETLKNGLKVVLIPKKNVNTTYVTYTANYGSLKSEFIPIDKTEFIKVPDGVAHFLEHKLFEQKDGVDPFAYFSNSGASANAYTSYYATTYLFEGTKDLEKNLNFLLDFVNNPYFTDENVEKEKGIIIEELKMYKDNPYRVGLQKILDNSFYKYPIKTPVIGTVDSIKKITKEDLYTCYNTFYNPSNMILVISGKVDLNIIDFIKENQNIKDKKINNNIIVKSYSEKDEVRVKNETIKMNVSLPKVFLGYKINISNLNISTHLAIIYLNIYFSIKTSSTSDLSEMLKQKGITNYEYSYSLIRAGSHVEAIFINETEKIDEMLELTTSIIEDKHITEEEFNRKKKVLLSGNILSSDSIFSLNDKIKSDFIIEGEIITDIYEEDSINYKDFIKVIQKVNLDNKSYLLIVNDCEK